MADLVEVLAAAVAAHPVRRVPLPVLRAVHARHDPTGSSSSDARTRLASALDVLAARSVVLVPRSRRLYETRPQPALPRWVEKPATPRPPRDAAPVRVWRPELAAAAQVASKPAELDVLVQVDGFLREGGAARRLVPHRERSIEVFGNEKRLDDLLRTKLFTSGALTLDLLRCFQAPLPLTAQHTGDPGPEPRLLIVENHATYASTLIVARERALAGSPAVAVGYGSGKQLPAAVGGVWQLDPVPVQIWYFGDLDEDGLVIARAANVAASAAGLPPLRPALPLYRALVDHGTPQPAKAPTPAKTAAALVGWLEDRALQGAVIDLLTSGHRLAQETVGLERLADLRVWV